MPEYEMKVKWEASSNVTFHGESEWIGIGEFDSASDAEDFAYQGRQSCEGLELALSESGFAWEAEIRAAQEAE